MGIVESLVEKIRSSFPVRPTMLAYRKATRLIYRYMPKGLYTRALLIIVVPILLLQSVLVIVFMERHFELVSLRMSDAVVRDIAAVVYMLENFPQDKDRQKIETLASNTLGLSLSIMPLEPLPPPTPKPYFDVVDQGLSRAIGQQIGKPFWVDTVGQSRFVEIRIQLENEILRVFARRSQTFASNSHIFLVWMFSTSMVLIIIAMLFLRNQIRPIVKLADAAESFGLGRPAPSFRPSGAREVRQAAQAFIEMRRRIERQMEQRTTMLAGVSHDLRTILTRFRLQLALFGDNQESEAMRKDVDEMTHMLEDYLAFARGDVDEIVETTDIGLLLEEIEEEAEISGYNVTARFAGEAQVSLRRVAFKRCLSNLVTNAAKFASTIKVDGMLENGWLTVMVDDDGPGIPASERETALKAFQRLDQSRNLNVPGSGLGLSIARDISRSHGGELYLEDSPLGGLRARVRVPV